VLAIESVFRVLGENGVSLQAAQKQALSKMFKSKNDETVKYADVLRVLELK